MNTIPEIDKNWATPAQKEYAFWYDGMTPEKYDEERTYYHENFDAVMDGTYKPLWVQRRETADHSDLN